MTEKNSTIHVKIPITILVLAQELSFNSSAEGNRKHCQVRIPDRIFDGFNLHKMRRYYLKEARSFKSANQINSMEYATTRWT